MTEASFLDRFSIRFWGTRGSIPVSGPDFTRYGGDTICIEVMLGPDRYIVDAGSGLRRLGKAMMQAGERNATLLLTHFHLDHTIGLTAFPPLLSPHCHIAIHAPDLGQGDLRDCLSRLLGEPFFPVGLDRLPSHTRFESFAPGTTLEIGQRRIGTIALRHGLGACGYRFEHAGRSLAVVTDHEHDDNGPDAGLVAFCRGADLLVYDAMWDETSDFETHRGWGHSSWQAGLLLLDAAGGKRLACIHHAPASSDTMLDEREARLKALHKDSFFACQDTYVTLG